MGPESQSLLSAVIHQTHRGPGAGGVRNWIYDSLESFLRDGLRLSKGMTHKNALAGIWWGGGKGVIARNSGQSLALPMDPQVRKTLYHEYGTFMSDLKGCYITAEDVGTTMTDMESIFTKTRYTTCIPQSLGGSGIPAIPTAQGVVRGLEAVFDFAGKSLVGSTIAVQGVGHVGSHLIRYLFEKGVSKIIGKRLHVFHSPLSIASDVDPNNRAVFFVALIHRMPFEKTLQITISNCASSTRMTFPFCLKMWMPSVHVLLVES